MEGQYYRRLLLSESPKIGYLGTVMRVRYLSLHPHASTIKAELFQTAYVEVLGRCVLPVYVHTSTPSGNGD